MGQIQLFKPAGDTSVRKTARSIGAATLANIATSGLFDVSGDVWLYDILLELKTLGVPTAETIRFNHINSANAVTGFISAASASIAAMVAGSTISAQLYAIANAPIISADGAGINPETYGHMFIPSGTMGLALAGTPGHTGTWAAYVTYEASRDGAILTPKF